MNLQLVFLFDVAPKVNVYVLPFIVGCLAGVALNVL